MRRLLLIITVFCSVNVMHAQVDLSGGMGISFVNNSSLKDYLNGNFSSPGNALSAFNSAANFFLEGDYTITPRFQLGAEYVYSLFSYNSADILGGVYDFSYGHHKPSLVGYYVISGKGYKFKFGGGVGLRFISVDEKIITTTSYTSSGIGFLFKIKAHTLLSGNFYAGISGDLRFDFPGQPKSGKEYINDYITGENLDLNSISVGIMIGISYFF